MVKVPHNFFWGVIATPFWATSSRFVDVLAPAQGAEHKAIDL